MICTKTCRPRPSEKIEERSRHNSLRSKTARKGGGSSLKNRSAKKKEPPSRDDTSSALGTKGWDASHSPPSSPKIYCAGGAGSRGGKKEAGIRECETPRWRRAQLEAGDAYPLGGQGGRRRRKGRSQRTNKPKTFQETFSKTDPRRNQNPCPPPEVHRNGQWGGGEKMVAKG